MDKRKFALLTASGFLAEIGGAVIMLIVGSVTGMLYNDLPLFAVICLVVFAAFGVLYSFLNRKAHSLHFNTPTYTFLVELLPVTLCICCLMGIPLLLMTEIFKNGSGFLDLLVLIIGIILTFVFGSVTTAVVKRVRGRKKAS